MKKITINSEIGKSEILIGESFSNVSDYLPRQSKIAVITDSNIRALYGSRFPSADLIIEIPQGESNKTLDTLNFIFDKLTEGEFDRNSFILGIGGGIVCDIAGFAAAIFMRGIDFGFVSTTLLSQVDASTGGKNGVNYGGYKNMIGTFCLPKFVICDTDMLKTLPQNELISGMAEVVKHGAIAGAGLFGYIEKNTENALRYDQEVLSRFVYDSVVIKSSVVSNDVKEKGARRLLNFGHTFGHAIEKNTGIQHGMAISLGMVLAVKISVARGLIVQSDAERFITLLMKIGLPVDLPMDKQKLFEAIKRDKKRDSDMIHFVLLNSIGSAFTEKLTFEEIKLLLNNII